MNKALRNILIIISIIFADQFTKSIVAAKMISFDSSIFTISFIKNTGAGFGILQGMNNYLAWLSLIALGFVMFFYYNIPEKGKLGLVFLAGGIISNLIDRVILGHVIDWIDFRIWPVFNIADSFIVIGVIWLIAIEIWWKE